MNTSKRRIAVSAAVSLVALAAAVPAWGQEAASPAAAPSYGDEIVVTANKREQSINDVGLSITAETGEDLLNRGINSPTDLGKIVPGLTVQPSPFNTPVYTLRGIGFYETTLSAAPTVAVYTDEVALPFSATTRGVAFDVQRVEVLKGPQGTLFGQNTTGGAINYIANKPTDQFDAGADLSFGRFNTLDGQAFVSGPITDGVKARLAVRGVHGDEWQKSFTRNDKLGRTRQLQGRFQLEIDPGSNFRLLLNANGWIDKGDTQAAQIVEDTCRLSTAGTCGSPAALAFKAYPRAPNDARAADWGYGIFGRRPKRDDQFWQVSARADLDLSDKLTLTSITAYSDYKTDSVQDFDGTTLFSVDTNTTGFIKDFSQELRLSARLDNLNIIVGGNYNRARTFDRLFYNFSEGPSSDPLFAIPGAPKGELTFNYSRQNVTTYAAFGNVEFQVSPNLTLLGGARYTKSKRSFEGCTNDFGGDTAIWWNALFGTNVQPGGCLTFTANFPVIFDPAAFDQLNEDNVAWNVGVNYKTDNDILLYARVSRGYKSGSFPTASVASYTGYTPVKQESVTAYEAGIKAPFANRAVEIAAAGFYYDYTDKQLRGRKPDPVFGTLDGLVQIPKSRVYGIEAQINVRPLDGLTLSAGGTYINTKINQFEGYDALGVLRNFAGQKFPYAPDITAIGDIEYEWAVGDTSKAYAGASVTYNSQTTTALANTNTQFVDRDARFIVKEYALLDLRAGVRLRDDKIRIGGYVRNVTNTFYWTNVQDNLASISRFAGMPRTYGVQLSWRY
ncbi:TonB-dependent receptor [Novosphingobium sp. PS1R-30]|uniref:TonB-dependent receptor n=1 Tax=Novosphingobium anseongense TaxID=3133436 RepID=A0ABU8S0M6_9SPHN